MQKLEQKALVTLSMPLKCRVQKIIAQSISWAYEPGDTFATEKTHYILLLLCLGKSLLMAY